MYWGFLKLHSKILIILGIFRNTFTDYLNKGKITQGCA